MSGCPFSEETLNEAATKMGAKTVGVVGEAIVGRGGPGGKAFLEAQMERVSSIFNGGVPNHVSTIINKGEAEKRVPFKNIEGFIENNQNMGIKNIDYLKTLHIIEKKKDGSYTLHDDFYKLDYLNEFRLKYEGVHYNKKLCQDRSARAIIDICNNEMNDYNYYYNILQQNINNYSSLYDYQMYLGGIINERINFLERIKNKINTYKQNIFTDNRKNSYLSSNLEFYKNIHFYIFILYYAIFIVFLIFSNFIKDKLYENKYVMIYVLIVLIIPFILRYILLNIYNLYISYIERNYLKLDEISYKYLVEETDQQINNKKDKQQLDNYHAIRNGN